jgi:acylphosphatase
MDEMVRAHLYITGKVQGVFYRLETQRAAMARNLTGWVRNLPDGAVEAVAEGERTNVESLIDWCRQGPDRARVDKVKVDWRGFNDEFDRFEVTYY